MQRPELWAAFTVHGTAGHSAEASSTGMDIEDDIRKGIEQARLRRQREQQQAAEQERQARERAGHVDKVWPYLERYQEAMRLKYSPSILECVKPKILRNWDKVVIRDAWRISTHYGDADQIGRRARYRLWLDAMSPDLWWQTDQSPACRIDLGTTNPNLSADENGLLEEAEKRLPRDLGELAEQNGIELFPSSKPETT